MGNACCGGGNYEMLQRQELLKEGSEFKKKSTYLGVLSKTEHIYLQLNPTATRLLWRLSTGSSRAEEIPIYRIGKVCSNGLLELVLLGSNGQKLLELTAESSSIRDLWVADPSFMQHCELDALCDFALTAYFLPCGQVQTLDEICFSTKSKATEEDSKALQQELSKQEEKQKEKYWKDRTGELEQRKLDAEERKKKIGLSGMKYTAQAMAKR